MNNYTQIIDNLIVEFDKIEFSEINLESIVKRCEILIKNIYGTTSNYLDEFKAIQFKPEKDQVNINDAYRYTTYRKGIKKLINLLKEISLDIQLQEAKK